jgi:hypothetical protein
MCRQRFQEQLGKVKFAALAASSGFGVLARVARRGGRLGWRPSSRGPWRTVGRDRRGVGENPGARRGQGESMERRCPRGRERGRRRRKEIGRAMRLRRVRRRSGPRRLCSALVEAVTEVVGGSGQFGRCQELCLVHLDIGAGVQCRSRERRRIRRGRRKPKEELQRSKRGRRLVRAPKILTAERATPRGSFALSVSGRPNDGVDRIANKRCTRKGW